MPIIGGIKMEEYRYNLSSTEGNSNQYGVCDVCGKHCTEMFYQQEERKFKLPEQIAKERGKEFGWTQHKCYSLFGHEKCLKSKQR